MLKFFQNKKRKFKHSIHIIKLFLMSGIIIIGGVVLFSSELERMFIKTRIIFQKPKTTDIALENKIKKLTKGYPIERMAPLIAQQDKQVASFLVAIAKKESNWGKRTPKLRGKECYNYWGFRRKRLLMGSGGHTCFDNPKDAVETVSWRIENLVAKGIDTPQKMVLWKCGSNCRYDYEARKWIGDVKYYYDKMISDK